MIDCEESPAFLRDWTSSRPDRQVQDKANGGESQTRLGWRRTLASANQKGCCCHLPDELPLSATFPLNPWLGVVYGSSTVARLRQRQIWSFCSPLTALKAFQEE